MGEGARSSGPARARRPEDRRSPREGTHRAHTNTRAGCVAGTTEVTQESQLTPDSRGIIASAGRGVNQQ